jgi:excisionase family DNA binding protein
MPMNTLENNDERFVPILLLRVEEAALRLGIGRTSMYRLVMSGEVESVPIGGLRRVPAPCLEEYVDRLRHRGPDPRA